MAQVLREALSMQFRFLTVAASLLVLIAASPATAQTSATAPASAWAQAAATDDAKPARRSRKRTEKKSDKEPTVGQMAARERQKKCGVEWKEAKAAGKTGGLKWPQFWSKCNARLKGKNV